MPSHPGQPSKVSKGTASKIAALIRRGVRAADAAEQCGIDRSSHFNWMKWGHGGKEGFTEYAAIIDRAVAEGKKPRQAG